MSDKFRPFPEAEERDFVLIMKVRFIPKMDDKSNPVVRLRCDMIIEALKEDGFDIGYYDENEWSDLLVIANTDFEKWIPVIEKSQKRGQIVVFDLPENEFRRMAHIDSEKVRGVFRYINDPFEVFRRFTAHIKRKGFDSYLEKVVRMSDHVTVSSEDTLSHVTAYNKNCSMIYEPLDKNFPKAPKYHENKAQSIIWIGMHVNIMYVFEIKDILKAIMEETGAKLKIITSPLLFESHPELRDGIPLKIDFITWDLKTIWHELLKADIGIAPLFKYIWKSPNKVVTYWAAGLPVVASPSQAYSNIIKTGRDGFFASNEEEWRASLLALIHDPQLRNRIGGNGYQKAVHTFSIHKIAEQWRHLFEELVQTKG